MTFNFVKGYSNKSNAVRAAKAANIQFDGVRFDSLTAKWYVNQPAPVATGERRRGGPRTKFSTVAKPCTVVREFVAAHPALARKDILAQLVAMGVDRTTASIQYHKARKAA